MPASATLTAVFGLLLLSGCGAPIPKVRANSEPEGQFVRVKSVVQAQAEQAHAQQVRREHVAAVEAALTPAAPPEAVPTTQPESQPATRATSQDAPAAPSDPSASPEPSQPGDR